MSYREQAAALKEEGFFERVVMAMLDQAQVVHQEDPETANHGRRMKLVGVVVKDPRAWARKFAYLVVCGDSITMASTDNALKIRVGKVWNAMAQGV